MSRFSAEYLRGIVRRGVRFTCPAILGMAFGVNTFGDRQELFNIIFRRDTLTEMEDDLLYLPLLEDK